MSVLSGVLLEALAGILEGILIAAGVALNRLTIHTAFSGQSWQLDVLE
jgi:hypothetical protein